MTSLVSSRGYPVTTGVRRLNVASGKGFGDLAAACGEHPLPLGDGRQEVSVPGVAVVRVGHRAGGLRLDEAAELDLRALHGFSSHPATTSWLTIMNVNAGITTIKSADGNMPARHDARSGCTHQGKWEFATAAAEQHGR